MAKNDSGRTDHVKELNEQDTTMEPLRRLLVFDTSTACLAAAVLVDGRIKAQRNIKALRNHSGHLVHAIDDCLKAAGITKKELDGIAVGIGPGSYTGVRIAVTTAKTLAWVLNIPVVGASSLEAIALGGWASGVGRAASEIELVSTDAEAAEGETDRDTGDLVATAYIAGKSDWVIPLIDARRGQAYTALFYAADVQEATAGSPVSSGRRQLHFQRMEQDAIRLTANWVQELSERWNGMKPEDRPAAVWFVGETGLHESVIESLRDLMGKSLRVLPYELEGAWMGHAGARHMTPEAVKPTHLLEPNYTQLSEAEAKRQRSS